MNMMTLKPTRSSDSLESIIVKAAAAVRPPERLSVSEAAEKIREINNPGSYVGDWKNDTTPYLIEPMDLLTSTDFTGMVFVGPAQCGKTDMWSNWLGYSAIYDPADMMLIQTAKDTARDFSIRRVDRLHRQSPKIGKMLTGGTDEDNVFDKHYASGMLLTLAWPSINHLSGKPIPRLWLTDYDRMTMDVDGEGNPFDLARKRATTFRSFGMTVAESSPGFVVENPKHILKTRHEAMPTPGILALYNRGDRRRFYWRCHQCDTPFEPDFSLLEWPDSEDAMECAEAAVMRCPHCRAIHAHDAGAGFPSKREMNIAGRWVKDGQFWMPDGTMSGTPIRSTIASFWLKGVAAAFSDWKTLVFNYITAEREYENTGSEEALKATINTDQGVPYVPKLLASERAPETIKARAKDYGNREVPPGVRFLTAAIDVQKNRFVVQITGTYENKDRVIVDRFDIRKSKRVDKDGERYWVNPGAHAEDWKLLAEEVLGKTYPLGDGTGRRMGIVFTVCDSGGKTGVTSNAYDFVRWLRHGDDEDEDTSEEQGTYEWSQEYAGRFLLLKGASSRTAPRVHITFPDSQRKDRSAGARGEIPVLFINTHDIKDTLNNMLDRLDPGGRWMFPNWLPDTFYAELTVEVKDPNKGWINPLRHRNESWDLMAYHLATCLLPQIAFDRIQWDDPPGWAAEWDLNDLVFDPSEKSKPFDSDKNPRYGLSKLAENLA